MNSRRHILILVAGLLLIGRNCLAQSVEYRGAIVDEGTYTHLNTTTPLNSGNALIPQPHWSNVGTAALMMSAGAISGTFGFATATSNLAVPTYRASIHELAADLSLSENVDVVIGKKILKWGTGYAFNPTGVVEPPRSPSDPSDRLSQNDGRTLASITAFIGKNSFTVVYVSDADISTHDFRWGTSEIAARAYVFLDGLDLSLIGHYRESDRVELGFNTSYVIGDNLELHAEVLGQRGSSLLYHPVILSDDSQQYFTANPAAALYADSHTLFFKTLLGGQYTFENGINVILEYYHNDEGLTGREWKRWMNFVTFHNGVGRTPSPSEQALAPLSRANILWALSTLSPRGSMRDYLFARGAWSEEKWGLEAIAFVDIDDGGSMAVLPTLSWQFSSYVSGYLRGEGYIGASGTEFGSLFTTASLTIGLQVHF